MLVYLDNYINFAAELDGNPVGSNENFARETIELHCLGAENSHGNLPREQVPGYPNPDRLLPAGRRGRGARPDRLDVRDRLGAMGLPRGRRQRRSLLLLRRGARHAAEGDPRHGHSGRRDRGERRVRGAQPPGVSPRDGTVHRPQTLPPPGRRLSAADPRRFGGRALHRPVAGPRSDRPGGSPYRAVERVPEHLGREGEAAVRDRRRGPAGWRGGLPVHGLRSPTRTPSTPSIGSSRPAASHSSAGTRPTAIRMSAARGRAPIRGSPSGGW